MQGSRSDGTARTADKAKAKAKASTSGAGPGQGPDTPRVPRPESVAAAGGRRQVPRRDTGAAPAAASLLALQAGTRGGDGAPRPQDARRGSRAPRSPQPLCPETQPGLTVGTERPGSGEAAEAANCPRGHHLELEGESGQRFQCGGPAEDSSVFLPTARDRRPARRLTKIQRPGCLGPLKTCPLLQTKGRGQTASDKRPIGEAVQGGRSGVSSQAGGGQPAIPQADARGPFCAGPTPRPRKVLSLRSEPCGRAGDASRGEPACAAPAARPLPSPAAPWPAAASSPPFPGL